MVRIFGDASGFKKAMGDMEQSSGGVKAALENATKGSQVFSAGIAAAGAAVVGFGLKSVQAYQESEQVNAQLQAVLKSTGNAAGVSADFLGEQSTELEHLTGVSDEAVTAGQAMLLTFTDIKGKALYGATQATLDMATAMNSGATPSMEQMKNQAIMIGKALNDPEKGLTKLTKVGVTFTDQQKEQIKALQASGDMMGAQQVILAELNKEFGGSAAAAGKTFTGQMNIAKETFGDFMELVGKGITDFIRPLIAGFNDWMQAMGGPAGMMGAFTDKLRELQPYLPVIIGFIIGGMVPAIYSMATAFIAMMAPLVPFLLIGAGLGLLIKALIAHFGGFHNLLKAIQPTLNVVKTIFGFLWDVLKSTFEFFSKNHAALAALAGAVTAMLIPGIVALLVGLWGTVTALAGVAVAAIAAALPFLPLILAGAAIGFIAYEIIAHWTELKKWFSEAITAIGGWFVGLGHGIAKVWTDIVDGLKIIWAGVERILTAPFKLAFNGIATLWNNTLGKVSFKLPDWIPGIGGKGFEFPKMPILPLATGGIVTKPTLALIGEAGPEAVIPLGKNGNGQAGVVNIYHYGDWNVRSDADIDEIVRKVGRQINLSTRGAY